MARGRDTYLQKYDIFEYKTQIKGLFYFNGDKRTKFK